MDYKFYGWETAAVAPVGEEYGFIKDPRHLYDIMNNIWCRETCAPRMQKDWSEDNKTLGQCSITAFLVQDIFGGKVYGILRPGGNYHCYNVIGDCVFDLTSEQFGDEKLCYDDNPEQFREVHFAKEEKRLRYEFIKSKLDEYVRTKRGGYICPVCGKYEFSKNGDYEICPECGWENDPVQNRDEDYSGGANKMSLKEARKSYKGILTSIVMMVSLILMLCSCGVKPSGSVNAPEAVASESEAVQEISDEKRSDNADPSSVEAPSSDGASDNENNSDDETSGEKYKFRNEKLLKSHYKKHGIEMGFDSAKEYEKAASKVAENPKALHKTEEEDGDDVYYIEDTNEFVVVSTDGYIRTYFLPDRGKAYFDRQ